MNTKANNSTKADAPNSRDALFLLSEYDIFAYDQVWNTSAGQTYSGSTIRTTLNKTSSGGTLYDCFSSIERGAILSTTNSEDSTIGSSNTDKIDWSGKNCSAYGCGLTGDKLFLLSAKEAVNKSYGFADLGNVYSDSNRITKRGGAAGSSTYWWLRSAFSLSTLRVAYVASGGYAVITIPMVPR